jgi:hypothetical protein
MRFHLGIIKIKVRLGLSLMNSKGRISSLMNTIVERVLKNFNLLLLIKYFHKVRLKYHYKEIEIT